MPKLTIHPLRPTPPRLTLPDMLPRVFYRIVDEDCMPGGIVFKYSYDDDRVILFRVDGKHGILDSYSPHSPVEIEPLSPGDFFTVTI